MDPMTGIAVVFGVQIIASSASLDVEVHKLLESTLYQGLNVVV